MHLNPDSDDYPTPFREWITEQAHKAGMDDPAGFASHWAPHNRFDGLSDGDADSLACLLGVGFEEVRAAHKADITVWIRDREVAEHPDLVVLDAVLDGIARGA
ncbi:hypothetical protein [Streptomyces leeuwenhoekii]|uniref:Sle1_071 protein n=1 Tax=Streptomyces leeuwenhoekii TaxID=1437453 RepID=A0A0F7VME2_STRLW|nr:hypothetical protein [Streptomyces leeuwenhoekii]CQR59238.1 sle1_071 [Streptomyces leeuwenhoekii]